MASTSRAAQEGLAPAPSAPAATLPLYAPPGSTATHQQPQPFDAQDPRVYFDRQTDTWKCEANGEEGDAGPGATELEWDAQRKTWVPLLDEDLLQAQQQAYSVDGVDVQTSATPVLRRQQRRRREHSPSDGARDKQAKQARKKINTAVFVSGLPLDATKLEIASVFSRYGVLYEDDAGEPRIKMYADQRTGMFKGEALVTYFKEESVDLAMKVLDESALRAAEGKTHPVMSVTRAEYGGSGSGSGDKSQESATEIDQAKHNQTVAEAQGRSSRGQADQGERARPTAADRKKAQKRFARMNDKLTDWNSDSEEENGVIATQGPGGVSLESASMANVRQVCLRRMFSLAELDDDPSLLLDLKDDVREECESLGKVTNVALWDKEPEGIMTVKFADRTSALACIQKMDGRFFGGRQVIAHLLEGKPRFRRSARGEAPSDEDGEDDDAIRQGGNGADSAGEDNGVQQQQQQQSHRDDTASAASGSSKEHKRRHDAFGDWLESGGDT